MHEQSLVRGLLSQVDDLRREHRAGRVTEIRVELGPLSGVEPLILQSAFKSLVAKTAHKGATLMIDTVALLGRCRQCEQDFEIANFVFRCPSCNGNVDIIQGDQLFITGLTFCQNQHSVYTETQGRPR